jgi:hypothetical protein
VATIVALATISFPASAGGPVRNYNGPEAEVLIKACWDKTLKERSMPSAGRIRSGMIKSVLCLEAVVVGQFDALFPDSGPVSREQDVKKLKTLLKAAGELYWDIYTRNAGCEPGCGLMAQTYHLSGMAHILEYMIREIIRTRKERMF